MLETKLMVLVNALLHWHVMRNYLKQSTGRLHFIADRILESWIRTQAVHGVSHPTNIFRYLQVEALFISFHSRVFPTTCAIGFCALFRDIKLWWLPERGTETQRRDVERDCTNLSDLSHSPTADTLQILLKKEKLSPPMDSEVGLIWFDRFQSARFNKCFIISRVEVKMILPW